MTRIAITGMGAVSAAGFGVPALWDMARKGRSGISSHDVRRGDSLRVRIAGNVPDFDPTEFLSSSVLRRCDRYTLFAHMATQEALQQSGLDPEKLSGQKSGVIIGTGIGGMNTLDDGCFAFYSGEKRVDPLSIPKLMPSSATSHISITYGVTGPCFCVTSACSSASQSIGVAMMLLRAGIVDRVIAGGSEACITPATIRAWEMMRVLSPDACRPFSMGRNGMIIGEGAGVFVLETEAAMAARGGEPIAWLSGYGTSSDARDIIQPDVDGAAAAMTGALADAGLEPSDIDYINAHGTGTVLNDVNEAEAIHQVFGGRAKELPVSSNKSNIGHTLGASGALEFIITINAMLEGTVPPHINFIEPDPKCDLFLPLDGAQSRPISAALSNSFAFGGINASLIATAVDR